MLMIEIYKVTDSIAPPIMNSLFLFRGNVHNIHNFQNVLEIVWYRSLFLRANLLQDSEAVVRTCSEEKVFLKISQNSQENTCARFSFLKKRLWRRCFPVNFAKFLRRLFFTEHLRWLFLKITYLTLLYMLPNKK